MFVGSTDCEWCGWYSWWWWALCWETIRTVHAGDGGQLRQQSWSQASCNSIGSPQSWLLGQMIDESHPDNEDSDVHYTFGSWSYLSSLLLTLGRDLCWGAPCILYPLLTIRQFITSMGLYPGPFNTNLPSELSSRQGGSLSTYFCSRACLSPVSRPDHGIKIKNN